MSLITSLSAERCSSWQQKVVSALLVFCSLAGSATVFATTLGPITGAMNLGGNLQYTGLLQNTTTLDFLPTGTRGSIVGIGTGTGDLATVTGTSTGDIVDFLDFASFSSPITNFLTIEGFQLDLSTLTIDGQSSLFLFLSGTGTLSGSGFDPTPASWSLSTQANSGNPTTYSMTIAAVPVPAAVWLFGSGLIGLVGVARRRRMTH
jgi:hypothetical protein